MSIITTINLLLDNKIIQWVLLTLVIGCIILSGILGVYYYGLKLENAILSKQYTTVSSALEVQNQAVLQMAKQTQLAEENLKQAVNKASKIALETQTILKPIQEYKYTGSCDEKVSQALELIQKVQ